MKGHNRKEEKIPNPQQGAQSVKASVQKKVHKGRHSQPDQSGGKKGQNAV